MRTRVPFVIALTCCAASLSSSAFAADFTDLLDAADDMDDLIDETYDAFDFNIEPQFIMDFGNATITREAACVPSASDLVGNASQEFERSNPRLEVNPERCREASIVDNTEADYRRQTMTMNLALRAGIYKDLELRLNIPYVISDVQGMRYAEGVGPNNSSIDPSNSRIERDAARFGSGSAPVRDLQNFSTYRFFDLEDDYINYERAGFGDPSIGVWWAPFNDYRDDTKATLAIGMDWLVPIAPIKAPDNTAVGGGVHELSWTIASSKRFDVIEPYFGLKYTLGLAAPNSPLSKIDSSNSGQVFTAPPHNGEITIGTEFVPYENLDEGTRYAIDLQFRFGYVSEGRDYSPMFDHMGKSSCHGKTLGEVLDVNDSIECAWIAQQPSNAPLFGGDPNPIYDLTNTPANTAFANYDGVSTVESYGTYAGRLGFILQPSKFFALKAHVQLKHQQEHTITNARTGRDVDDSLETTADNTVDLHGPDARLEKNPVFNPTYDGTGRRFRVQEYNTWSVFVTAAFQF